VFDNNGARAGDRLLLTKSLGTGVISTALKKQKAETAWVEGAVRSMTTLNKTAAEVATRQEFNVHTMTDITGFGLIGHARELAKASGVSMRIDAARVPLLPGALECVRGGHIPGGLKANREFAECVVEYAPGVAEDLRTMLFDPQTAGGLLISVAASDADALAQALKDVGVPVAAIGEALPPTKPLIRVD
jgi:selenide, water dikinase